MENGACGQPGQMCVTVAENSIVDDIVMTLSQILGEDIVMERIFLIDYVQI